MPNRAALRKARYSRLRALGFSRNEATRLRDQSEDSIETETDLKREQIESVPVRKRTPQQRESLRRINRYQSDGSRRGELSPKQSRQAEFNQWSKAKAFPLWAQTQIDNFNTEAGYEDYSSYGYRVFFHMYVNRNRRSTADNKIDENPNAIYDRRKI